MSIPDAPFRRPVGVITVRKARWGWWVDGRWCPTRKIMCHEIRAVKRRTGKTHVRSAG